MIVSLTFNKTELQQVLFPFMFYYGIFFLTLERRIQFGKAIYLMEKFLNKLSYLPKSLDQIPYSKYLPELPFFGLAYLDLSFFQILSCWIYYSRRFFFNKIKFRLCFSIKTTSST